MKHVKYLALLLITATPVYGAMAEEQVVVEKVEEKAVAFEHFLDIVAPEDIDGCAVVIKVAKDKTKTVNNKAWAKIFEACSEYGRIAKVLLNKDDDTSFQQVVDHLVDLLSIVYPIVKDEEGINGALELRMFSDKFQKLSEDFVKQNELEEEILQAREE